MIRVTGVSLPRSGHHVLANALQCYFGPQFTYCEGYHVSECCHQSPCASGATFTKTHDFSLGIDIRDSATYLVQMREPGPALVSDFELSCATGFATDTRDGFVEFAKDRVRYYKGFYEKWIAPGKFETIAYADLVHYPFEVLRRAVLMFEPDKPVSEARLRFIIQMLGIHPRGQHRFRMIGTQPDGRRGFRYVEDLKKFMRMM